MKKRSLLLVLLLCSSTCRGQEKIQKEQAQHEQTTVTADTATYDGNRIILSGNVDVSSETYQVQSNAAILIRDDKQLTRFEFPWIELTENIQAQFLKKYFLECDKVNFDYVTSHLIFTAEKRIFFYEGLRKIYAEKADIEFVEKEGKVELLKITLLGNVEMHQISTEENDKKEQYALADRVEYFPDKELLLLRAESDKRVLFFDKIHEVTISSQTVKAQKKNGREVIEGIGDVRFVFKEEELEKLKKQFEL